MPCSYAESRSAYLVWLMFAGLCMCACLYPGVATAQGGYVFERTWPTLPQPWFFNRPAGVAPDNLGHVYVSDTFHFRIHKFSSDGHLISIVGNRPGEELFPIHLTVGPDGTLFAASGDAVVTISPAGVLSTFIEPRIGGSGLLFAPSAVAVDPAGFVYVLRQAHFLVQKYSPDGDFVLEWGDVAGVELQVPETWNPGIAAAPDGTVYAIDLGDVSDGDYIVNKSKKMVKHFSSQGDLLHEWGTVGYDEGMFNIPFGVAVDGDALVYVADVFNNRVQVFDSVGTFVRQWGEEAGVVDPSGLGVDDKGSVFVSSAGGDGIQKYTKQGRFITQWASQGSEPGRFLFPEAVDVDDDGAVYIADTLNSRIQVFSSDGQFVFEWGELGRLDGELVEPQGIVVDVSHGVGDAFVADTGTHRIQRFLINNGTATFVTKWGSDNTGNDNTAGNGPGELKTPIGLALDYSGFLFVVDSGNNRIQKFDPTGEFIFEWGTFGDGEGEFDGPTDIAIDSATNVFVTDPSNQRVQKFTDDGEFLLEWGTYGEGLPTAKGPTYPPEFREPAGIAVGPDDQVHVVDFGNNRVQIFTVTGEFINAIGAFGDNPGQFSRPRGVAVGNDGTMYVVDTGHQRIQAFSRTAPALANKAIIVAGGGPFSGNELWPSTQLISNFAYRTLVHQGYNQDTIRYLTPDTELDLDNNPDTVDISGDATLANLEEAILTWAATAQDVIVHFTGPSTQAAFRMNETEMLEASMLDSWLDALQESLPGTLVVSYDASRAAEFLSGLTTPAGKPRVVTGSTGAEEEASFFTGGLLSYSNHFWLGIFNGKDVYKAYRGAVNAVSGDAAYQQPVIDDNGNGIPNEAEDGELAMITVIVNETNLFDDAPIITGVSPPQELELNETSAAISAFGVLDDDVVISRVWAVITPPPFTKGGVLSVATERPTFDLSPMGGDQFDGTFDAFVAPGEHRVDVFALDKNLNLSLVAQTVVSKGLIPSSIVGIVTDDKGPLEGALVELTNLANQFTMSDGDGFFLFSPLADGHYALRCSLDGFETEQSETTIEGGGAQAVNFLLGTDGGGNGSGGCAAAATHPASMRIDDALFLVLCCVALVLRRRASE